jgi:long-chain acyl-CoA synthetase
MTQKPWLATYGECDIPAEINPDVHRSVVHMLERAMTVHANKPAFRSFGQTLTYADVNQQSRNFASYLQTKLGVKRGDRIAVMMPNLLAFPITFLGIIRAGGVQVNVNPLYTPRELEHQLAMPGSRSWSFSPNHRQPWRKSWPRRRLKRSSPRALETALVSACPARRWTNV